MTVTEYDSRGYLVQQAILMTERMLLFHEEPVTIENIYRFLLDADDTAHGRYGRTPNCEDYETFYGRMYALEDLPKKFPELAFLPGSVRALIKNRSLL